MKERLTHWLWGRVFVYAHKSHSTYVAKDNGLVPGGYYRNVPQYQLYRLYSWLLGRLI